MSSKKLYLITIGLVILAFVILGYNSFYANIKSSYFDLFYKTINLSVLLLLIAALSKDKLSAFLKNLLTERQVVYETSVTDLASSDKKAKDLKVEKETLAKNFIDQKKEALDQAQKDAAEVVKNIATRSKLFEADQKQRLAKMRREFEILAKLKIYDEALKDFELNLKNQVKAPAPKDFDKLFKILK